MQSITATEVFENREELQKMVDDSGYISDGEIVKVSSNLGIDIEVKKGFVMFKIDQEIEQYNMIGVVRYIFEDTKKVVLYFEKTDEEIEFDFDEFE